MTPAKAATKQETGHAPNSGSTTLHGRIEAIGIHDLLRVSTGKGSTGRLLVFNDSSDAEIYYEVGRLVAVVSGASFGPECLQQVLLMQEGEFEFAVGLEARTEHKTPALHEAMIAAVREHYEQQVRNRQALLKAGVEEPRSSGVHKIDDNETSSAAATPGATSARNPVAVRPAAPRPSTPQTSTPAPAIPAARVSVSHTATTQSSVAPRPSLAASNASEDAAKVSANSPQRAELLPGELGSAAIDASGRVLRRLGTLTQHEAALAALALKLATRLGASLGARESQGVELHAPGEKALFCVATPEGIRVSKVSPDADPDTVWKQLRA